MIDPFERRLHAEILELRAEFNKNKTPDPERPHSKAKKGKAGCPCRVCKAKRASYMREYRARLKVSQTEKETSWNHSDPMTSSTT